MRAHDMGEVEKLWKAYALPRTMKEWTFLDVGCWGGGFVRMAHERDAELSVGIDTVKSPHVGVNIGEVSDKCLFYQMDVFSEKFLMLPRFDLVLCAGLLYHVANPMELLCRLKAVVKDGDGKLVLETVVWEPGHNLPQMSFCDEDSVDDNHSNWWISTPHCLDAMLWEVGFYVQMEIKLDNNRNVYHLGLNKGQISSKLLPRKKEYMDK